MIYIICDSCVVFNGSFDLVLLFTGTWARIKLTKLRAKGKHEGQ